MKIEYSCFAKDFRALCLEKKDETMITYDFGFQTIVFSYREVYVYVERYMKFFQENQLEEGDAIIAILPNSPEMIICFFAAMLYGLKYAPLPCNVSNREYDNWMKLVHPKLILKKDGIAEYSSLGNVYNCICDGDLSWLPEEKWDVCNLSAKIYLMTSGTTGIPKAMSIDINTLWSSGRSFVQYYGIENSSYCFWNYLPMSYLGGLYNLALIPLCCKGRFVISEPFSGKTILNFWDFVERYHISALWLVPSIVQGLLKISGIINSKQSNKYSDIVQIAFLGTAPIQKNVKELFEERFGIRLFENFALSESTFLTVENERNISLREEGSVGQALPYVSIKLLPIDGVEEVNEIWIKSPFLFEGYLNVDGELDFETDSEGYFNTKDLGYWDKNEILILSGRNRDIIKKGGHFVSLVEIESVVKQLPNIEDVVAVSVQHEFYGESYILCTILKDPKNIEKQKNNLRLWMQENFVSYKMPERICVVDEFPRTASGKIKKNVLSNKIQEVIK